MILRLAASCVALLALSACSGGVVSDPTSSSANSVPTSAAPSSAAPDPGGLSDDAVVTYEFHDSSVPPPFHRSVTLTVTKDSSHIVIDSYGDVLADRTDPTPPAVWSALGASLPEVTGLTVDPADTGCTGGTGITLTVESGDATLVDLDPQFCGGSNSGLDAAIDAWIAPARDIFPSTSVLAPADQ